MHEAANIGNVTGAHCFSADAELNKTAALRFGPSMADDRSDLMSRIRGDHTAPERALRAALWARGLRYRLHLKTPAGRPDVVFPGRRVAVFIDGCFWHGCPDHYVRPRSNTPFWSNKLRANVERDRAQTLRLEEMGWRVVRLWEHQVFENLDEAVSAVEDALAGCPPAGQSWRVVRADPVDAEGRNERRLLEDLRDSALSRQELRPRTTAKWKRPEQAAPMVAEPRVRRSPSRVRTRKKP